MALQGTLKDFGIADILQLIGNQQKTGTLHLKSKGHAVDIAFSNGNIVRAETAKRDKKDLIGAMLVQAQLITEGQLEHALETQRRTLERLGDVLVAMNVIGDEKLKKMVQLQATETLYKLFTWKSGNYQFEQGDVEADPLLNPLRAESVLMEGFRMVDEWPIVKKKLPSMGLTFQRVKELPLPLPKKDSFDDALDAAMGEGEMGFSEPEDPISDAQRKIYALIAPDRTVQRLVDLGCVGEFETCKALVTMVEEGYLAHGQIDPKVRSEGPSLFGRIASAGGRVVLALGVFGGVFALASGLDFSAVRIGGTSATTYTDPAMERFVSLHQMSRIASALQVYEVEKGALPEKLEALVEAGLLNKDDVSYPWRDMYYYRRGEDRTFVLLPPLR